ncbi:hypothetical protein AYM40_37040 (plasmid) [Paraburkholderia phytofirmans OLGA172]|uniref:Uncharacterized protein n=1 Tax=Paraburkholderia phytofirmans OLGA172 TaxID=1417228 RepID=A0A167WPB5_9BURK|nr:hypothetical protein [Paraburkholderia phytofirmans]ANB77973.1 hypothetical protein AYM40_37040 [Paraburkholderia phytofirmans OLGA172]
MREALRNAAPLPKDTRITVRRTACKEDHHRRAVDELARGLGLIGERDQAADEFTFLFSDIKGEDADSVRYRVGSMRDVLTWDVPETAAPEGCSRTSAGKRDAGAACLCVIAQRRRPSAGVVASGIAAAIQPGRGTLRARLRPSRKLTTSRPGEHAPPALGTAPRPADLPRRVPSPPASLPAAR